DELVPHFLLKISRGITRSLLRVLTLFGHHRLHCERSGQAKDHYQDSRFSFSHLVSPYLIAQSFAHRIIPVTPVARSQITVACTGSGCRPETNESPLRKILQRDWP